MTSIQVLIKETEMAARKLYAVSQNRDSQPFVALLRAVDKLTLWAKGDFEGLWLMEREDKQRLESQLTGAMVSSASAPSLNLNTAFDEESPIEHDDETGTLAIPIGFPALEQNRFARATPISDLGSPIAIPSAFQPVSQTLLPSPVRRAPFLETFF